MSQSDSSVSARLTRLAQSCALLGQPDIISIKQIRNSSSFFQKEKKLEDVQQNFINGLIFPTTAHFSSFISTRYKGKDPTKISIRAKLFMFDAFAEKDIHIEVSIPGQLEAKTYNLKGQAVAFTPQDYQRAYYSSFLRSLRPMSYPNIILYPLLNRIEILRPILRNFVSFSVKHELRLLGYDLVMGRGDKESPRNLALQILLEYLMQNRFDQLLKIVLDELRKISPGQTRQLEMESKLIDGKYAQILSKTAQKLLLHGNANQLKQYQLRALIKARKYAEAAFIGRTLIESGGTTPEVGKLMLAALIQSGEERRFLKTLNLVSNLVNQNQRSLRQVSHIDPQKGKFQLEGYIGKSKNISEYPELCFPFDNTFFNRLIEYQNQRKLLQKNSSKEGLTLGILDKVQESLTHSPLFYDALVRYEKTKGWKNLLQCRADCFWLQSDFLQYEHSMRRSSSSFNDNFSFFDHNFDDEQSRQKEYAQQENFKQKQYNEEDIEKIQQNQQNGEKKQVERENPLEQSFDGNLSEHEEQKEIDQMPRCSTRFFAGKANRVKIEAKILCGGHLEKLFLLLFSDIKLQNSLEIWEQKLKETDSQGFSVSKRELAGMIFLKKGFLHKKLQRNKKCEQALKLARKLSQSSAVSLVATYQLVLLYVDNKNVKGVQFYLVQLIKLLKVLGVQFFDIVPEWAKPVLQFVVQHEGLSIIKNIHPLFKTVFALYLRSNYTQEEVDKCTQLRREK